MAGTFVLTREITIKQNYACIIIMPLLKRTVNISNQNFGNILKRMKHINLSHN